MTGLLAVMAFATCGPVTPRPPCLQDPARSAFGSPAPPAGEFHRVGRDYALLIGVDDYPNGFPHLSNPVQDVRALKATLEDTYGFSVTLLENPTREKIYDEIDQLSTYPFKGDDQLLVFFAGHGYFDADRIQGYLLPSNATNRPFVRRDPDGTPHTEIASSARGTFIEFTEFAKALDSLPVLHELLILDACFAGNMASDINGIRPGEISKVLMSNKRDVSESFAPPPLSPDERRLFFRKRMRQRSRIVLCSGDQTVPDGPRGQGSPFANKIRGAIAGSFQRGYLTFEDLYSWVYGLPSGPVRGALLGGSTEGDFLFMRGSALK